MRACRRPAFSLGSRTPRQRMNCLQHRIRRQFGFVAGHRDLDGNELWIEIRVSEVDRSMEKFRSLISPITLALLGMAGAIYATRWGVGLIADSKYYLGAAQSLLNGQGLVLPTPTGESVPMTNWPPLFSTVLAGLGLLGIDLQVGARWLNLGLFGASIL